MGLWDPMPRRQYVQQVPNKERERPGRMSSRFLYLAKWLKLVMDIWRNDGYEVKKAGKTGATVQHLYRDVGIDCLQFCMIVGLNLMWSGLRSGARVHGGPVRKSQSDALAHLRRAAEYVIDGKEAAPLKGVPRTPKESWESLVKDARISYHGEVIQKAEALEFDRVLPSLPPEGFGGIAELASLCEGKVKEMVLNPKLCQLEEAELPDVIPAPRVRAKEWRLGAVSKGFV